MNPPTFQPLGDQALLTYCRTEEQALHLADRWRRRNDPWLIDVVQAYTSVAVFFALDQVDPGQVRGILEKDAAQDPDTVFTPGPLHKVPCCYAMGLDLERVAEHARLSVEEVIRLHAGAVYTVYAIGFCPGFPYLGYLPDALCGVPRLPSPRIKLEAGSVGLTGRQTGIYTEARPGGWNIVGRTPLELVHVADGYFPLRTGDRVQFEPIDAEEYHRRQGQRLAAGFSPNHLTICDL